MGEKKKINKIVLRILILKTLLLQFYLDRFSFIWIVLGGQLQRGWRLSFCKESQGKKIKSNGYKLHWPRFYRFYDLRRTSFAMRMTIQWNNLPRDIVESPSLLRVVCKMWPDRQVGIFIQAPFSTEGWRSFPTWAVLGFYETTYYHI